MSYKKINIEIDISNSNKIPNMDMHFVNVLRYIADSFEKQGAGHLWTIDTKGNKIKVSGC